MARAGAACAAGLALALACAPRATLPPAQPSAASAAFPDADSLFMHTLEPGVAQLRVQGLLAQQPAQRGRKGRRVVGRHQQPGGRGHGIGDGARRAADDRQAMRQRLVEDQPVPLVSRRQREDRGACVKLFQPLGIHPPRQHHPIRNRAFGQLPGQRGGMGAVPGIADDHRLPVHIFQLCQCLDQHVMALARMQDAHRQDQRRGQGRGDEPRPLDPRPGDGDAVGRHAVAFGQQGARMGAGNQHVARKPQVVALGPVEMRAPRRI